MRAIGLDVHRDFCEVAIAEAGELRSAGRIETKPEQLELFARSLAVDDVVALEATGNAAEIARIIESHVARVIVVSPSDTGIRQARAKTDRLDARTLARLTAAGSLDAVWMPDERTRAMRRRLARRAQLVRARTRAKNEIHAVLVRRLKGRPPVSDLVDRGLDPAQGILFVIDGSKALAKGIRDVFGSAAPIQRCIRHKERNVLDHLPEVERGPIKAKLRAAWSLADHARASERLRSLAGELERSHPGAAASLREGIAETVTLQRLGACEQLRKTLASTNPCESMIEIVRRIERNVKRWQAGDMRLRWTAAGMLEAERQFRRIIGYRDLANLAVAVEREVARGAQPAGPEREEVRQAVTV